MHPINTLPGHKRGYYAINISLKDVYLGFVITFLTNATLALGTILIRIIKDTTIYAMD